MAQNVNRKNKPVEFKPEKHEVLLGSEYLKETLSIALVRIKSTDTRRKKEKRVWVRLNREYVLAHTRAVQEQTLATIA